MTAKSSPNISVFDLADWFLVKARTDNRILRNRKLQKLLYFTYGWYHAYFDKPLFDETISAWKHGPVIDAIYQKYKVYGKTPIAYPCNTELPTFDDNVTFILESVWKNYAPYRDTYLSEITHRTGSPWYRIYYTCERYTAIPTDMIYNYFKSLKTKYDGSEDY